MSSASTPRVTRSASPDNEDGILTPGRKIKAMLAAFDSDSGSDTDDSALLKRPVFSNLVTHSTEITGGHEDTEDEDEDEDEDLVLPKGRMAARMQAQRQEEEENATMTDADETAYDRVTRRLHVQSEAPQPAETLQSESAERPSNDGLYEKGPKRRLLHRGDQSHATEDEDENPEDLLRRDRSESPLFVQNEDEPGNQNPDEIRSNASPKKNERFLALVAQKRKEREERERIEAEKRAARVEQMKQFSSDILSGEDSDDEEGSSRMLTQQARPARKASKKALEEMSRETQRMSRSMQLTHQARTKKKITKESFLARFNFGVPPEPQTTTPAMQNSSTTASSAPSSDGESNKEKATPPTSPIRESFEDREKAPTFAQNRGDTFDLPTIDDLMTESSKNPEPVTVERAKVLDTVPAPQRTTTTYKPKVERKQLTKPPVRVRFTREDVAQHQKDDGDDDLEVITSPARCRKLAAFENLPARHAQESASMLKLKLLAHLTSPSRKSKSMSPAELSASLRLQARQQALQERREKIEELRAKGIVIESAEDRAAMEADVEDLLDKARQEAAEIARREKAARKKGGKNGEGEEDSDDEADYIPSGSEDEQEIDAEDDHDSEREDEEEDEDEEDGEENGIVEDEAGEADESEGEQSDVMSLDGGQGTPVQAVARKRRNRVISDDEEEDEEPQQQPEVKTPARSVPASAGSAKRPQFPDLSMSNDFTMGLTQAFAGTLGDSQPNNGGDSFKIIQSLPDPGLPTTDLFAVDSQVMVKDSQEQRRDSIDLFADYTQSNSRISESPARHTWSQPSQIPEPTQDAGFVLSPFDQSKRFADPPISTIDTVLLPEHESPIAKRKGRLLQRGRPAQLSDEEDDDFEIKASAFDVMKKAAKKPAKPFDKMKSEARGHFDEAAEESEDEYAGLGGASDDEVGDEDEYDQQMINDDSQEVVDEKQLAALNAYVSWSVR
jgi:mediator of replication checkpoint protein 1